MKNSEISTVAISRNKEIQANIHTAMVRLNEFNGWKVGMPLMVKYYNEDHEVDTLFAVGVKDSGSSVIWKELSEAPSSYIDVPILPVDGGNTQTAYREKKFFKFKTYWDNADAVAVTYTWTLLSTEPPEEDYRVLYHVPVSSSEATPANPATKGWNDEIVKVVLGVEEGEDYDLSYYLSFNLAEVSYWRCRTNEVPGVIVPPDNKLPDDPIINAIYRLTDYYVYESDTWRRIDESEVSEETVVVFELPEVGEPGVTYQMDEYYAFYGVWERLEYIPESYDILIKGEEGEELPKIGETDKIYYVTPDKYYSCTHNGTAGRDFYDIISTKGIYAVDDVLELRPGISYALNGERYLYYYETPEDKLADNGQWKIARRLGNSLGNGIPLGSKPRVFKNLSNDFQYFYQDGKLKKENDFITPTELAETPEIVELREQVEEIMDYLFPLTLNITETRPSASETYTDEGDPVKPLIFWNITRRGVTVQPTMATVNDSTVGVGTTFLGYAAPAPIHETTTYNIKVWYGRQVVSETVTYTFVD